MSKQELSVGLDYPVTPDIQTCLSEALHDKYLFIVLPVVHPRFRRHHIIGKCGVRGFTRSDVLLSPQDWSVRVVGKLSPYIDVDIPSEIARQRHEDCLHEELTFCRGLGLPAIMVTLHGRETTNLARILTSFFSNSYHPSLLWARVPLMCNKRLYPSSGEDAWSEPWHWWSQFHEHMGWDKHIGLVLEISADLPSEKMLMKWFGEPIRAIILPTSIFCINKKGYPVLSRGHQQVVLSLLERDVQVVISGAHRSNVAHYIQYLYNLWNRRPYKPEDPMLSFSKGWEDYLQTPLQPLADNLDSHTYNVFEKDPVKYDQYQKAVAEALRSLKLEESNGKSSQIECINQIGDISIREFNAMVTDNTEVYTIMVLGAGRGPLIRAVLNAADITQSRVKVIAVEKNPCAVVALEAQVREVWRDRDVSIFSGDMRRVSLESTAHIIVSELLGSWADNELSPECLDGAARLLRPDGISIPQAYTSYAVPITSPRLWAAAKTAFTLGSSSPEKNLETLWVVYMQNKFVIGDIKPIFHFEHPTKGFVDNEGVELKDGQGLPVPDNRRMVVVNWKAEEDCVMHGFGGYFDCTLFSNETLSILPTTHTEGMISWFPVFIPIKTPLRIKKHETIKATFWRCVSARRVWYEWIVKVGNRVTPLHNSNGKSSEMLL